MSTGRLLVVDDDPNILSMLERGLRYEGFAVHCAANGEEGLDAARSAHPDLVVLDILLPGIDGLEVCRRLRAERNDVPVLMLTARDEVVDRVVGLETGADDYLVKPFAFEELVARVRALLRRRAQPAASHLSFSDLLLDPRTREVHRGERLIELTRREFELLETFLRHPRQAMTREQLLAQVWGYDFEVETNAVDVYVGYLRRKLEAEGEPRLLHTIRGVGYSLREPRPADTKKAR
jgi:two-component system, OmpR family, response regulator MprA